jgi:hypothetical protein
MRVRQALLQALLEENPHSAKVDNDNIINSRTDNQMAAYVEAQNQRLTETINALQHEYADFVRRKETDVHANFMAERERLRQQHARTCEEFLIEKQRAAERLREQEVELAESVQHVELRRFQLSEMEQEFSR